MSDILIKNMKMPENCLHCGFSYMASDCLKVWIICKPKDIFVTDGDAVKDGRPDWCPLVEVPSADVEEVERGVWCEFMEDPINQKNYGGQTGYYECSNCKFVEDYRPNFCPNCGSDMRKAGET